MWVTVPFAASHDDGMIPDFVARIRGMAGEGVPISHYVMTHYNSMMALKAALEKAGEVDKEALIDGLEGVEIDTPTGPLSVGAGDHHVTMKMYLAKTEGLDLRVVEDLGAIAPNAGCA